MSFVYRLALASSIVVPLVAGGAVTASASCAAPPSLENGYAHAEVVFIGRVVELSNDNRSATVEVEQVWKGPELPDVVVVHGGPEREDEITSVDRQFGLGSYVFFPTNAGPPFTDNSCSLTQPATSALDAVNPFLEEPPDPQGAPSAPSAVPTTVAAQGGSLEDGDNSLAPWIIVLPVMVAALGLAFGARHRRANS